MELTDQQLRQLVERLDVKLLAENLSPSARFFQLTIRARKELGIVGGGALTGPNSPLILQRMKAIHSEYFRDEDLAVGSVHAGIFTFRGLVGLISIPHAVGEVRIDAYKQINFSDLQKSQIQNDPISRVDFAEAFNDILYFGVRLAGWSEFERLPENSKNTFELAGFHLQSSAAVLSSLLNHKGATQSAILASELSLKAALRAFGYSDKELKNFSHDLRKCAETLNKCTNGFLNDNLERDILNLPPFVPNRYSEKQPNKLQTASILMSAQRIAAAAMRTVVK